MNPADNYHFSFGALRSAVEARLATWAQERFAERLWQKDHTIWFKEPRPELTDRLGWLSLPQEMHEALPELALFSADVQADGCTHAVLLGMGGSSLAPEVFQRTFGNAPGYPELVVLDSTHPEAVAAVRRRVDPARTLFLVASKSGGTLETLSFFRYFWELVSEDHERPGERFVALTDPGSPLDELAQDRGFRRVFPTPPEVGGRYSALTFFGLVPAAAIGADVHTLLDRARSMVVATLVEPSGPHNPPLALGALLGEGAVTGRDKVTFLPSSSLEALPDWIEQLIAESTGKEGRGILPVATEPLGAPETYGDDRVLVELAMAGDPPDGERESLLRAAEADGAPTVRITLTDPFDLAREMFAWEVAVAAAGSVLGINPFDQPDVQLAKEMAKRAMEGEDVGKDGAAKEVNTSDREALAAALAAWEGAIGAGDYIALQAYLAPSEAVTQSLQRSRTMLRDRHRVATTLGYGPRFLHSTGQLHKGGPDSGAFLQVVDDPAGELPVPETDFGFRQLITAQARGDLAALLDRGRRVLRVNLGSDAVQGLSVLEEAIGSSSA